MHCLFCGCYIKGTLFRYKDNSFCSIKCRKKELYNDYLNSQDLILKNILYQLFKSEN
jgi:hypothetical protein